MVQSGSSLNHCLPWRLERPAHSWVGGNPSPLAAPREPSCPSRGLHLSIYNMKELDLSVSSEVLCYPLGATACRVGSDRPRGGAESERGCRADGAEARVCPWLGRPSPGALLSRGPDCHQLCGWWVKESTTSDNCPCCPDAYTWSFNAHTIPAKKVPAHLSDAKTKAGRGGT